METLPITARSFEKDYHINGDNFERSYKEGGRLNGFKRTGPITGFKTWEDADHAEDWVIIPKNEIESGLSRMLAIRFDIEHLTGKEVIELVRRHQNND